MICTYEEYLRRQRLEEDKQAGYNQKGANNNNYKGPGKRSYSADHKAAAKSIEAKKCTKCGSTKDLQRAVVKGSGGKKFRTLCRSCHAKYDNFSKNFKK